MPPANNEPPVCPTLVGIAPTRLDERQEGREQRLQHVAYVLGRRGEVAVRGAVNVQRIQCEAPVRATLVEQRRSRPVEVSRGVPLAPYAFGAIFPAIEALPHARIGINGAIGVERRALRTPRLR